MKRNSPLAASLALLLAASAALADHQESRVLTWPQLQKDGKLLGGQVGKVDTDGSQSLRISNAGPVPTTLPIAVLDHLSPTANNFAVDGKIRYQGVEGDAYLEMWTVLPDGRRFFTRTLAEVGPLQKITGTSPWRPFALPFDLLGQSADHVVLEINVVMSGAGTIDIGPLRIVNLSPDAFRDRRVWWSGRQAPWAAGVLAIAIGLTGAVLLILLRVRKGASRTLVTLVLSLVLAFGAACTVAGVVAVVGDQPDDVFFPLLVCGAVMVAVALLACFKAQRHWREIELRKMQAMDT